MVENTTRNLDIVMYIFNGWNVFFNGCFGTIFFKLNTPGT